MEKEVLMHIEGTHLPKMHLHLKKNALHKDLGVKPGKKLTMKELQAAKQSKDPLVRKRATFALNARKWNHK